MQNSTHHDQVTNDQAQPQDASTKFKPNVAAGAATVTTLPVRAVFPEIAFRGLFADYRSAMAGTTEASDVAHFATFWAAIAVTLGRLIHMYSGDMVYPNEYLAFSGPTGDKKTTAQRRILSLELGGHVAIIQNAGSTEGLAKRLMEADTSSYLFLWEEFATLLSVAGWSGSTLLPFLTEVYDCPPDFNRDFVKNKIELTEPTPTVLTMTTPEWFWRHAKAADFFGGFANRFVFLSGPKKQAIPNPEPVDGEKLAHIKTQLQSLRQAVIGTSHPRVHWTAEAGARFAKFYRKFESTERKGLLAAALKRTHVHVRKLSMIYAFLENTLPEIHDEQLEAAIAVISHSALCTKQLLEMQQQSPGSEARRELEIQCIDWIQKNPGGRLRSMQQALCRNKGDSESFHRVVRSLVQTDQIEIRPKGRKTLVFSTE